MNASLARLVGDFRSPDTMPLVILPPMLLLPSASAALHSFAPWLVG